MTPSRMRDSVLDVGSPSSGHWYSIRIPWRIGAFIGLALCETFLGSSLYGFPTVYPGWSNPVYYTNWLALILMLTASVFPLVAWPRRAELTQVWRAAAQQNGWAASIAINLGAFALLLMTRAVLSSFELQAIKPSWYWGYSVLVLSTGASLALVAAPPSFWRDLAKKAPLEMLLSLGAACFVLLAAELSKESWYALSVATLVLSHWILGLYEGNAFLDMENRILGAEDFRVQIWAQCAGYEGIGLIVAFLAIYIWVFRAHLRFPNAFCLFPIGIGAIWLLNSVRIASLVSIGAHVSPTVALDGFHSWSGWIAFLIVTVGIMTASRRSALIWAVPLPGTHARDDAREQQVLAYLAPFTACMAASIVASAFTPADQWLYALKVTAISVTLLWFRDVYVRLVSKVSLVSIIAGVAVGVAWIATDPQRGLDSPIGAWLANLPVTLAVAWIAMRALGSVVLVPVAEELAFRGYLCRALTGLRSARLSPAQLRWIALIASSVAFGVLHERWLAATLSGAVYAALMVRTGRISDPIAAHMASNGMIMFWSVVAEQWTLL